MRFKYTFDSVIKTEIMSAISAFNKKIDSWQVNYFGIMSITVLAGTCIASVAVILIVMNEPVFWQIALISTAAMASNAAGISSSPLRWIVWLFSFNVLVSVGLIILNWP